MGFISIGGRELWHSDTGEGAPLVWIHGGGSDGRMWADDLAPLAEAFRVVTYNRRGYVGSGSPAESWSVHADDAITLIESLAVGPVTVAGYSIGSVAALDVSVRRPDLVERLILVDPAFRVRSNMTPRLLRTFATAQLLYKLGRKNQALAAWMRYALSYSTGGNAYDRMPGDRRARLEANVDGVFADFATGDGSHIDPAAVETLSVPVTLISAELSPPFLRKSSKWLAEHLPSPQLHAIPGAGHAIAFDRPEELLAQLVS